MWWSAGWVVILALLAVEWLTRGGRAGERREWASVRETLSRQDRRLVNRAVWRGEPVADARLAPAVVAFASVVAGTPRPLRLVNAGLGVVWFGLPAVVAATRHEWGSAAIISLAPLMIIAGTAFSLVVSRRAQDALAANRRVGGDEFPTWPESYRP